jgi:Arsenical resistance operon protein ArsD
MFSMQGERIVSQSLDVLWIAIPLSTYCAFMTLEEVDWLETTGILVERFDPSTAPNEVAMRPVVQQLLSAESDACLPLILVNNVVVSRGTHPSRTQLARAVGRGPATVRQIAVLGAVAAVGSAEELQSETARARALGIDEGAVSMATDTGVSLRQRARSAA